MSTRVRLGPSPRRSAVATPPAVVRPDGAVAEVLAQVVVKVLRQLTDDVGDIGLAGHLNGLRRDDLYRTRAHFIRRGDARSGDDDFLQRLQAPLARRQPLAAREPAPPAPAISARREPSWLPGRAAIARRYVLAARRRRPPGREGVAQRNDGHRVLVQIAVGQTRTREQLVEGLVRR